MGLYVAVFMFDRQNETYTREHMSVRKATIFCQHKLTNSHFLLQDFFAQSFWGGGVSEVC
jgi:hypothetical protein